MDTDVLYMAFSIISLVVGYFVNGKIKNPTRTADKLSNVMAMVGHVVDAAEQLGKNLGFDAHAKFEYAFQTLESFAKRLGLDLEPHELQALIESYIKNFKVPAEVDAPEHVEIPTLTFDRNELI